MKMITLPQAARDALRDMKFEVRVPEEIAVARARVPIEPDGRDRVG